MRKDCIIPGVINFAISHSVIENDNNSSEHEVNHETIPGVISIEYTQVDMSQLEELNLKKQSGC